LLDRYGEEHHRVGAALHNVAVANLRAGQLNDAQDAIDEAIRIRETTLGEKHSKVADSMVERGIILLSMKEYDESLKVFKKALRLREKEVKLARTSEATREAKLKVAKIRHNIGCVNFEVGNLDAAEEAFTEAITAQKSAFGTWSTPFMMLTDTTKPGFLTMASTMCNRGYIAMEQTRYAEAISIFFESLKVSWKRAYKIFVRSVSNTQLNMPATPSL
jgi:tetratricopeptide (TPR) repeat protein